MTNDLVCFSHLRWHFVLQRPQHLLTQFALHQRVFYIEEPGSNTSVPYMEVVHSSENIWLVTPHLNADSDSTASLASLINKLLEDYAITDFISWYYSPMAFAFSKHLNPVLLVYDCMDELSAFKFAPPDLKTTEASLMSKADIVFTGGYNLFHAKKSMHNNIHPFPSSIDKCHFEQARTLDIQPNDQENITGIKIGFYGVLDERLDIELIEQIAISNPEWQLILIGPVAKIDPASLPEQKNIHYLGSKHYNELPAYLAGWDAAMMPFKIDQSTEFISPTKTPEFLSGGKRVISTPIKDVVDPYGNLGLVFVADSPEAFIQAIKLALSEKDDEEWLANVDDYLKDFSWHKTFANMNSLMTKTLEQKTQKLKYNHV